MMIRSSFPLVLFAVGSLAVGQVLTQKLWVPRGADIHTTNRGNVGVGTNAPQHRLSVAGSVGVGDPALPKAALVLEHSATDGRSAVRSGSARNGRAGDLVLNPEGGAVGVGTWQPDPGFALSVNGKVRAKELKVETGWADFVFADDYELMPLADLEAFIHSQHHLPGVPTAEEVEAEGLELGAAQVLLLQKVEELTLYVLDQERRLRAQASAIEALKRENEGLRPCPR